VWWDINLTAGENWREVIDAADAVIMIWTPHSITSYVAHPAIQAVGEICNPIPIPPPRDIELGSGPVSGYTGIQF
jgi:hypothetical protein